MYCRLCGGAYLHMIIKVCSYTVPNPNKLTSKIHKLNLHGCIRVMKIIFWLNLQKGY